MANTYNLIASSTVGSGGTASVTFSSIPGTYTDLIIKASLRTSGAVGSYRTTFNSSSTGYSERLLYGTGTAVASAASASGTYINWVINTNEGSSTTSTFSNCEFYIPNYASSNNKPMFSENVTEQNGTGATAYLDAALWANSAAITSITFALQGTSPLFVENSTFYLYGIKNS
jgi:hypothetical protein